MAAAMKARASSGKYVLRVPITKFTRGMPSREQAASQEPGDQPTTTRTKTSQKTHVCMMYEYE